MLLLIKNLEEMINFTSVKSMLNFPHSFENLLKCSSSSSGSCSSTSSSSTSSSRSSSSSSSSSSNTSSSSF